MVGFGCTLKDAAAFIASRDGLCKQIMPGVREHAMTLTYLNPGGSSLPMIAPQAAAAMGITDSATWLTTATSLPMASPSEIEATVIVRRVALRSLGDGLHHARLR